jgi:hypothetical protein
MQGAGVVTVLGLLLDTSMDWTLWNNMFWGTAYRYDIPVPTGKEDKSNRPL